VGFLDRRDLNTRERVGQKTMNQYRINYGKARIIRIEKIKASESLCWVWREGIVQGGTEKRGSYLWLP